MNNAIESTSVPDLAGMHPTNGSPGFNSPLAIGSLNGSVGPR
jgi:hypothetical protein